jgi:predicted enzyme related to lactoylglutathione lyase
LREKGVTIIGDMEEYDYGRFAHIVDPEGNKIDLWEPKD